jgi:hypothetical protein
MNSIIVLRAYKYNNLLMFQDAGNRSLSLMNQAVKAVVVLNQKIVASQ